MDTWEVVLILIFVTVALVVLGNQNLPLDLIQVLDNSMFQLLVLGLTLAVAVFSPAVAVVAITTIVIIYYVRNLTKVEMVSRPVLIEEASNPNQPRITITEETTTVETTTKTKVEIAEPDDGYVDEYENTKDEDLPAVDAALTEHDSRLSLDSPGLLPKEFKMSGSVPVYDSTSLDREDFENPRSSMGNPESVDPKDLQHGAAPTPVGTPSYVPMGKNANDSDVFTPAPVSPHGFNEAMSPASFRPYDKDDGQYAINTQRPFSLPMKTELASYMPDDNVGSNSFTKVGVSIDDKVTNLAKGIPISSAPPPNFDLATPSIPAPRFT